MAEEQPDPWAVVRDRLLDADRLVRGVAAGRQRNRTVPFRRVELRYVDLRAGRRLQVTALDQTQAHTRNLALGRDAEAEVDRLLAEGYASWHVQTPGETVQLRVTKKGRPLLSMAAPGAADDAGAPRSHDRVKRRRLDERDELFAALGIADGEGRVKPGRAAKLRQIEDFLAALEPVLDALPGTRPLPVVDLGCGNAYLTFAAHRFLTARLGAVRTVGVDLRPAARQHNTEIAAVLGVSDQVRFLDSPIASAALPDRPGLVLALHACDTATDDALARAVRWEAPVILAAPCCHHDVQRQLREADVPPAYRLVTRHGILGQRWADVLTDALRAAILRLVGYRVEVIEFVDSRHTPRNALIRAVRTGMPGGPDLLAAYLELVRTWQVRPALAQRLGELLPSDAGPGT